MLIAGSALPLGVPVTIYPEGHEPSFAAVAVSQPPALDRLRQYRPGLVERGHGNYDRRRGGIPAAGGEVNPVVLSIGLLIAGTTIGFNWIHERNDVATPAVQVIAGFFPGKVRA